MAGWAVTRYGRNPGDLPSSGDDRCRELSAHRHGARDQHGRTAYRVKCTQCRYGRKRDPTDLAVPNVDPLANESPHGACERPDVGGSNFGVLTIAGLGLLSGKVAPRFGDLRAGRSVHGNLCWDLLTMAPVKQAGTERDHDQVPAHHRQVARECRPSSSAHPPSAESGRRE